MQKLGEFNVFPDGSHVQSGTFEWYTGVILSTQDSSQ